MKKHPEITKLHSKKQITISFFVVLFSHLSLSCCTSLHSIFSIISIRLLCASMCYLFVSLEYFIHLAFHSSSPLRTFKEFLFISCIFNALELPFRISFVFIVVLNVLTFSSFHFSFWFYVLGSLLSYISYRVVSFENGFSTKDEIT